MSNLKTALITGGAFLTGWILSDVYTRMCISNGLKKFDEAGLLKWFNEAGEEIGLEKAIPLIKEKFNL